MYKKLVVMRDPYVVQYEKNDEKEPSRDESNSAFIEKIAVCLSWFFVLIFLPFSLCFIVTVAMEYQRLVMFRLGRIRNSFGPGLVFQLPCIDSYDTVDIRTDVVNVSPQEMLTKDSVTIKVNAVVFYCIHNPIDSIIKVDDARDATERISQVTLRNIVGSMKLNELLTSRQQLSKEIQQAVAEITGRWGVKVERVDIMEISLPKSLERSLAIEAETVREARARVILAEGEAKASQFLKESSDVMSDNQITLQLRHLQVLSSLAPERHVTVIFPIPLAIMEPFNDENENEQNEDDKRRKDDDRDDQLDYLHMFSPKVVISGTPPEEDKKWSRFWKWPPFGTTRGPDDGERPSGSQRGRTGNQQPSSSRRADRTADSDPYPLLPQPETSTKSVAGIPIPPRPDPPSLPPLPRHPKPPSLPPIPPHPNLPPVPPHPRLPPLPDKPAPPPKPTSSSK